MQAAVLLEEVLSGPGVPGPRRRVHALVEHDPVHGAEAWSHVHPRTRRQHQRLRLGRGWPLRGRFYQYHDLDQLEPDVHQRPAGASWHGAGGGSRTGGVGGRGAEGPARGRPQQGSAELRRPGHAQHAHHDRGQSRQCQLDSCRGRQLDADFHQREQHYQREHGGPAGCSRLGRGGDVALGGARRHAVRFCGLRPAGGGRSRAAPPHHEGGRAGRGRIRR
mmetsp:Transcript_76828/g.200198  ORF Transcript_76828/g.200198 Transcript_76828/m.200198 type:complete len:220 (+) Transcript_76828:166-825(+)